MNVNFLLAKVIFTSFWPLQDLEFLCNGLEGRSSNPVALLFDHLHQPNADLVDDEKSRLEWRHDPATAVTHRVLGKGAPGGSWRVSEAARVNPARR